MYSTTSLQLFNQLMDLDYKERDLKIIYKSYEVAKELCSCLHRPSGNTHISHLIGTSSILASLRIPIEICAAGLLHSVYTHGDFGDGENKIKDWKRTYIRNQVGKEIEEYVAAYAELDWFGKNTIPRINKNIDNFSNFEKDVFLIRIADALEEFCDFGNLYVPNPKGRIKYFQKIIPDLVEISKEIGFPSLGIELEKALIQHQNKIIPEFLRSSNNNVYIVPPMNCRKKMNVAFVQNIRKKKKYIKVRIKKLKKVISNKIGFESE